MVTIFSHTCVYHFTLDQMKEIYVVSEYLKEMKMMKFVYKGLKSKNHLVLYKTKFCTGPNSKHLQSNNLR